MAAGEGAKRQGVVRGGRQAPVMNEEDFDATRPEPGNGFPRVGQQAIAGAAALMTQPGDA